MDGKQREKYINDFYGQLYKKRLDRLISIEDFLDRAGDDADIQSKKLSEGEKMSLEGKVTLDELEKSLDRSNMNSACGWDGVSYSMIKKFWLFLGPLLRDYANEAIEENTLGTTFRTGLLKIIPKKGNATRIGDWRPITLLCCGYKIVSGMVANRIEKYLKKLLGRGQKGFLKHKNINSCTINIIDNISQSWAHGEKMGVLCVDFSKAFDSVEHLFIDSVLEFYNFGPNMRKMVNTILNNREAKIMYGGRLGEPIKIARGTPQGDRASPYLFILCIEILLIKINKENGGTIRGCEFNENMRRVYNLETMLTEAYADDLTILFKWDKAGLKRIVEILEEFALVSGLQINVEKTQLMITGGDGERIDSEIHGIKVVDKIGILGVEIDRRLDNLSTNWEKALRKMGSKANYWNLFRLSIGGRAMVAKTYLISQLTYLMGAIPVDNGILDRANEIIIKYVNGRERKIAADRIFHTREQGGYGITDMRVLNMCIKATWIRKWCMAESNDDYAELRCIKGNKNEPDHINMDEINTEGFRCSGDIMRHWIEYKTCFYEVGRNMLETKIFKNDMDRTGNVISSIKIFSPQRLREVEEFLGDIKLRDLLTVTLEPVDLDEAMRKIGVRITFVEFFRLRGELYKLKNRMEMRGKLSRRLITVFKSKDKGSKVLRLALKSNESREYYDRDARALQSVQRLWLDNAEEPSRDLVMTHMGLWGKMFLDPGLRDFLFRYVQGRLHVNQVRAAYDPEQDPYCSFCMLKLNREFRVNGRDIDSIEYRDEKRQLPHESVRHLFWECDSTRGIIAKTLQSVDKQDANAAEYLIGSLAGSRNKTELGCILLHWSKYWIYGRKIDKRVIVMREFEIELTIMVRKMQRIRKYRDIIGQLGII